MMKIDWYKVLRVLSASFGVLGSFLLCINIEGSQYGWILFFFSSLGWIIDSVKFDNKSMLWMQLGFTVFNIIGIYRWIL